MFTNLLVVIFAAISLCFVSALPAADTNRPVKKGSVNETPEDLAKRSFEQETKGKIPKYRVANRQESESEWSFLIVGTEEYERPGFHWLVTVDKKSKRVRVIPGQ